jgi:hypothetical protein
MYAIEEAIDNFKYKYGNCISTLNMNCDTYVIQAYRLGKTPIKFSINKYHTMEDLYTLAEQEIVLMNSNCREASACIEMTEIYEKDHMPIDDEAIHAIFFARGSTPVTVSKNPNITFIDFLVENKKYIDASFSRNKIKFYIVDCECFRKAIVQKMKAAYS